MHSYVPLSTANSAWMMTLPVLLFLWRKKRTRAENGAIDAPEKEQAAARAEWLYVGRDEDGTPMYLDTESLSYESDNPARLQIWVKYRPSKGSAAFLDVESFLGAAGKRHEAFETASPEGKGPSGGSGSAG
jgi:hypothetical protein